MKLLRAYKNGEIVEQATRLFEANIPGDGVYNVPIAGKIVVHVSVLADDDA